MAEEIEVTVVIPETPVSEVAAIVEAIEPVVEVTPTLIELALRIGALEAHNEQLREKVAVATAVAEIAEINSITALKITAEAEVEEEEEEEEIESSEIPAIEEIPDSIEVAEAMPEIQERGARRSRFI